jgi:hypothetical protein
MNRRQFPKNVEIEEISSTELEIKTEDGRFMMQEKN